MRFFTIVALVCMTMPAAYAGEINVGKPVTLDQVIINVLENNPQFSINDYEAQAAAARIRRAIQQTPLEFKVDFANIAGSGKYSGSDQLETTLSLAKILESNNRVTSREEIAEQSKNLLSTEQDSKRLDLLTSATEQFIHVVVDQYRLKIAKDHLALVQHTLDIVIQRVRTGKSHVAEQRRLVIDLARAELELEHAEHELEASRLKLATYWGETRPKFSSAQTDLFKLPLVAAFDELEKLLLNNPDLVRFASEESIAQARLKLAQSRISSNIQLSAGVRHFNATDEAALVMSLSIPFGSESRAQPEIDEMQLLAQREPLRYRQQYLALYRSLFEIYQELQHARTAYQALSQRIIPEAKQAAADYEQGYKAGRFSLMELNEALATLLDARLEEVMTAARYHRLKIEIERLTGTTLRSGKQ